MSIQNIGGGFSKGVKSIQGDITGLANCSELAPMAEKRTLQELEQLSKTGNATKADMDEFAIKVKRYTEALLGVWRKHQNEKKVDGRYRVAPDQLYK